MLEQRRGKVADIAVRTVQVIQAQSEHPLLNGNRAQYQLSPVNPVGAKLVPEPEQFGITLVQIRFGTPGLSG